MWTPVRLSCAPQRRRLESDPAIHRFGGVTGIGIEADFRTRRMRMDGVDDFLKQQILPGAQLGNFMALGITHIAGKTLKRPSTALA